MEYDYVIVGAGSAGCVLANRLSANNTVQVCLLEAGGEDTNPWIHIPAGYVKTMVDPAVNWLFQTTPDKRTADRPIPVPRGKVLGGSSAINGMLYVRGQARDYDTWAQMGCTGWSSDEVLPYFKRMEHFEGGADDFHAIGGPLNVAMPTVTYDTLDKVISAGGALGYPTNTDYNGAVQDGFGYYQLTQRRGKRFSAKTAYLEPVRHRPHLHVETNAFVQQVLIEDGRAVGVRIRQNGQKRDIRARREVILAAGAVQSPQLLELSGIGQGARLQALGIPVIHDLPGVGENLQDHYISRLTWRLKGLKSLNQMTRGIGLIKEVVRFFATRKGALTMPAGIVYGFVRTRAELETPDMQFHIAHATFADAHKRTFDKFPGLTIGPCKLRPDSRGSIHATTPSMMDKPDIAPNFMSTREDCETHVAGMKLARDMMAGDTMRDFVETEIAPGIDAADDDALLEHALKTGATLYHPVGTCRMGSDPGAVVDAALRVHGVAGLRVVDASVMPRLISGNTNAPTMMIAEKASDLIATTRA